MRTQLKGALIGLRKSNNTVAAKPAKIDIRERVLSIIGADHAHVFDAFSGEGELYRAVWHRAASYVGVDLKWYHDDRLAYVADNRRLMRALDLARFNVFDLDAYGSPWDQVWILGARRRVAPGERIGLVLTEGTNLKIKMGTIPFSLARLTGLDPHLPGAAANTNAIMDRALAETARLLRCKILRRWEARGKAGSAMRYYGLILQGNDDLA